MKPGKKIKYLITILKEIREINALVNPHMIQADLFENLPRIFYNDKYFVSYPTDKKIKKFYFLIKKQIRRKITQDHLNCLFDIKKRYLYSTAKDPVSEGKYYGIKEGDIVFEVGAYTGIFAIKAAELCEKKGKVIAIEAIPENYRLLEINVTLNNIEHILPLNVAIYKEKGFIDIYRNSKQLNSINKNVVSSKDALRIPCDTIDNIFEEYQLKKVDFIRIQINGAEEEAIQGMNNVLKYKPKLLIATPYINSQNI